MRNEEVLSMRSFGGPPGVTRDFAAWAPRCDRDAAASFYIGWSFTFSSLGHSPACRQLSDVDAETRKQAAWTAAIVRDNVVRLRSLKTPPSKITTFAPHKVDVRTYIKGIDYVSRKASNPSNIPGRRGSNNYNLVLLSPDCFKRMCMMSRTKKAEMVRSYFIDVETQFLRYREELLEGLRRDLNPQRAALPPSACKSSGAGYLYIIRATDDGDRRRAHVQGRAHVRRQGPAVLVPDRQGARGRPAVRAQGQRHEERGEVRQGPRPRVPVQDAARGLPGADRPAQGHHGQVQRHRRCQEGVRAPPAGYAGGEGPRPRSSMPPSAETWCCRKGARTVPGIRVASRGSARRQSALRVQHVSRGLGGAGRVPA